MDGITYENIKCEAKHCDTEFCNDPTKFSYGGAGRVTVGVAMVIAMVMSLVLF